MPARLTRPGRHPFKDYATIQRGGSRQVSHFNTLRNIANKSCPPNFYTMSRGAQALGERLLDKNPATRLGVDHSGKDGYVRQPLHARVWLATKQHCYARTDAMRLPAA